MISTVLDDPYATNDENLNLILRVNCTLSDNHSGIMFYYVSTHTELHKSLFIFIFLLFCFSLFKKLSEVILAKMSPFAIFHNTHDIKEPSKCLI